MARPVEKPIKKEGKWIYKTFMGEAYAFPAECASEEDISVMNIINASCKKDTEMWISDSQHKSLTRLLRDYSIKVNSGWR